MKKITLITMLVLYGFMFKTLAQAPQSFNYQAIVRDISGAVIPNHTVGLKFSIIKDSMNGSVVCVEIFNPTTNKLGLVNLQIGSKNPTAFNVIDWSTGTYFFRIDLDSSGGTNYKFMGTQQLISVPYALYAKTAGSSNETQTLSSSNDTIFLTKGGFVKLPPAFAGTNTDDQKLSISNDTIFLTNGGHVKLPKVPHYIGELYGGGVVFYVDHTGEHGLICSMIDLDDSMVWSNVTTTLIGASAKSTWNGRSNTNAIINQIGHTKSAAKLCDDYTNANYGTGVYSDWYLPSIDELILLFQTEYIIDKVLDTDGNSSTTGLTKLYYWSSYESSATTAKVGPGDFNGDSKQDMDYVRAVRAF